MPTIEGGCLCGAVRYRSDAEAVMQVVCHCETCRKNSGSAFSMNVAVPQDRLSIESGSPRRYEDHSGASGRRSTGSSVATAALTFTATARHTARSRSLRPARSTTRAGSRPTCTSGAPKNCPGSIFPRESPRHPRTRAEKDSNSPASSQRNPSTRLHCRPRRPRQDPRNSVHSERKTPVSPVMALRVKMLGRSVLVRSCGSSGSNAIVAAGVAACLPVTPSGLSRRSHIAPQQLPGRPARDHLIVWSRHRR
jgi:Glutathione-dependent formaldehyde-activating enzyme